MNLNNFEKYIDQIILNRGYSYYIEGNVVETIEQSENCYLFYVEGSDDYEVLVEIGEHGDILFSECNCPYDFGPVCKHEVAAYYQLHNMLNNQERPEQPTIHDVLTNLSKEELIRIITSLTDEDDILEKSLILKYSITEHKNELETCRELIESIVRKYGGRDGFIKYRDVGNFAREWDHLVEKARDTEDALLAMDIALLLLEEAVEAFQYADDSNGDIGFLASEIMEVLAEIAIKSGQRGELFSKLLAQVDNIVFEGWSDIKMDLLQICMEFAEDAVLREQLRGKIESMIDRKSRYENESLLRLLFQLIEDYGTSEEAEQFIYKHQQFSSFREQLLNKHLQSGDYYKALEVATAGEKKDEQYPGLVDKWKKYRYLVYKSLSLKEEQQNLAKELLFGGNFKYYFDLKQLAEKQSEFYTNLKNELKAKQGWRTTRIFLELINVENDLEEMLEFVKKEPSYIEEYAEKLVKPFREEVIEIYKRYIESVASASYNRRGYQGVCQKIKRYQRIAGKEKKDELVKVLMGLYQKRPAFLDELGRI